MPHTNTWETKSLLRKFSGILQPEEILSSNIEIQADPKFTKIAYIINDFTAVTEFAIDANHTKVYASTDDIISDTKGKFNIAIVVKDAQLALANSYKSEMKNRFFKCEIFQTVDDARKWAES